MPCHQWAPSDSKGTECSASGVYANTCALTEIAAAPTKFYRRAHKRDIGHPLKTTHV